MAKRTLPSFVLLWSNYPDEMKPCDGGWENQCAIRLSISLVGAGFPLTNYRDPKCKHGHARGAESLANYLWHAVGPPMIAKSADRGRRQAQGENGLLFFKDLAGFRGGIGDHFDLWKQGITKTGEYFDSCKETWFWEAK